MTSQPSLNATREIARYLVSYLASRQWTLATIEASLPSTWRLVGVEESDFQPLTIGHVARVLHTHVQIAR